MGIETPLVVYTHTDVSDLWEMFFGQLKKFMPESKVYVAVNKKDDRLNDYIQIIYDDSNTYTERWKEILPQIKEEVILFLHEDMVLYDFPMMDYIKKYSSYVSENKVKSIKLISIVGQFESYGGDTTLIANSDTKFSIQPTIIKPETFLELLEKVGNLNIWEFEEKIPTENGHYMAKIGYEKRRGIYHNDSFIFPYISTAINKGKWNLTEYETELGKLFNEYNINPFDRGIC